jgi:hypothetical protein
MNRNSDCDFRFLTPCPIKKRLQVGPLGPELCAQLVIISPSVFRMFAAHVGIDVFLKGLSTYLKRHLYGNTISQDLWHALSETAGFDVGDMLREWMGEVC